MSCNRGRKVAHLEGSRRLCAARGMCALGTGAPQHGTDWLALCLGMQLERRCPPSTTQGCSRKHVVLPGRVLRVLHLQPVSGPVVQTCACARSPWPRRQAAQAQQYSAREEQSALRLLRGWGYEEPSRQQTQLALGLRSTIGAGGGHAQLPSVFETPERRGYRSLGIRAACVLSSPCCSCCCC